MSKSSHRFSLSRLRHSKRSISHREAVDTGMALVLICLAIALLSKHTQVATLVALFCLLVTMIAPSILKPIAVLWLGFSHGLGMIMSTIILSTIYFLVVTPMGWLSQKFGKDSMKKSAFKKEQRADTSAFIHRNHTFVKHDLTNPY